jgi:hypothetical protein
MEQRITPIDDTINLQVVNNTAFTQPVSILGGNQDPNATTPTVLYQWDLSGENYVAVFNTALGVVGFPSLYQVLGKKVDNIQDVLDNLNSFGLGTFRASGNVIYISSNQYVFNKIDLF